MIGRMNWKRFQKMPYKYIWLYYIGKVITSLGIGIVATYWLNLDIYQGFTIILLGLIITSISVFKYLKTK
jgi:NhaP-type Na+/H+ and K+/H+ antiporter